MFAEASIKNLLGTIVHGSLRMDANNTISNQVSSIKLKIFTTSYTDILKYKKIKYKIFLQLFTKCYGGIVIIIAYQQIEL